MSTLLRQDQATISVGLPGIPTLPFVKSWSKLEGGDLESEDTKTRPGGMVGQVNLGGPTTRSDATVSRPYTLELHRRIVDLENYAGSGEMKINWTTLDSTGSAAGHPTVTIYGILKNVMHPGWDANATGAAEMSLVMGCNVDSSISQ